MIEPDPRLLRPFPVKKLAASLYFVEADANSIHHALLEILINTPTDPEAWRQALDHLETLLASLSARCGDAMPVLEQMADQADADHRRALNALRVMLDRASGEETPLRAVA